MQPASARPAADTATTGLSGWFETLFASVLLAYVAFALVAVAAAMLGAFRPVPMLLCLPLGAAFAVAWHCGLPRPDAGRAGSAAAACAVLLVLVVTAFNARYASQHLVVDNDPAVYAVTAQEVADDGTLLVETDAEVFGDVPGVTYGSAGFYAGAPGGALYPQFAHLLPLTLAAGDWAGGPVLLLRTAALLGGLALLCFFALAATVVRPWWALLATGVLAVNFPQVYFSRDTFSEVLTQALLCGGLALLWRARQQGAGAVRGALAGATIGATGMARVDAYVYLAPLLLWAAWELLRLPGRAPEQRGAIRRCVLAAVAGAGATMLLGYAEVRRFSPVYLHDLGRQVRLSAVAVAAGAAVAGLALAARHPLRKALRALAPRAGAVAAAGAALVVALAAFAWLVRPSVETATQLTDYNPANVAGLQRLEGVPVDGNRTYFEESVRWLEWYLGPVTLAAGFAGLALLVWRLLRGRAEALLPLLLVASTAAYYVYRPSVTPIHVFADRRFVPVAYPALVLGAVALCATLWSARSRVPVRTVAVVVAAASVAYPARQLADMPDVRHGVPLLAAVERLCDEIGDSAVLVLGGLRASMPATVAAHCDVPVAVAPDAPAAALVADVASAVERSGRRLVLLADDPASVPPASGAPRLVTDVSYTRLEPSLTRRPTTFRASARLVVYLAEVR